MDSLYKQYVEELDNGLQIIELPEVGFATFRIHKHGECFIEDMFVLPEVRGKRLASELENCIITAAKEAGCHQLTHLIVKTNKTRAQMEAISARRGFKFLFENENESYYEKDIL